MKKILFLASLAAVAMTSCTSESNEYVGGNTPKEITFAPVAQKATRAAVPSTTFTPTTMQVAAYDATTASGSQFFASTTFTKGTTLLGSKS